MIDDRPLAVCRPQGHATSSGVAFVCGSDGTDSDAITADFHRERKLADAPRKHHQTPDVAKRRLKMRYLCRLAWPVLLSLIGG